MSEPLGTTATNDAPSTPTPSSSDDREDALLDLPLDHPTRSLDKLARTDSVAGKPGAGRAPAKPDAETAPAASATPPVVTPPTPPPASDLDEDTRARLQEAHLRTVPGETNEAALRRLTDHYAGYARSSRGELREVKEQVTELRQYLEPMFRAYYQQQAAKQQDEMMAQIPDRETNPQEYQTWLLEQAILQDQQDRTQATEDARLAQEQAEQQAEQAEEIETVLSVDESITETLETAVANDPDTADAYNLMTAAMLHDTALRYPTSTVEQQQEFVRLAQLINMRQMQASGLDIPATIKASAANLRKLASMAAGGGNGNGAAASAAAAPVSAPPASPTIPAARPSPTAERLAAASQAASARTVVSPSPAASSPSGIGVDIRGMSEDDFVDAALSGALPDEQREKLLQEAYGQTTRRG